MMIRSGTRLIHRTAAGLLLVCHLGGCGSSEPPQGDQSEAVTVPQIEPPAAPLAVNEGELLVYQPQISNRDQIEGELVFAVSSGELPPGSSLDEQTGQLEWTPGETAGPGTFSFELKCYPASDPEAATSIAIRLNVVEANTAPAIEAPQELTVAAGSTLEQSIGVVDSDFPANGITLELAEGPKGALVDDIGKLLYWEIPADWQQPQVTIKLAARDDGGPAMTSEHSLLVTVTGIVPPESMNPKTPATTDRLTEAAVHLPPLPRPGEPIEPVPLEVELDPPVQEEEVRLSLLLPDELRSALKMRYIDDRDHKLAILLTNPFEADDVEGNLSEGIVATCVVEESTFVWTWAMTKDLTARGYQNNLRNGVLTIESQKGGPPRLVALQQVEEIPAPSLADMLGGTSPQYRLTRVDRVTKSIPLEGIDCCVDNGPWQVYLETQVDSFALLLKAPKLTQRVNAAPRGGGIRFADFGFRLVPHLDEITIELDATPSPSETYTNLRAARKSLINKKGDATRWQKKLAVAQGQLQAAQRMPTKTPTQRAAKGAKISQSTRAIKQASERLKKLSVEIPADENLVSKMQKQWDGMVKQLQPVQNCVVSGELWRRIGDVRVPVLRLVPVEAEVAAE